jgi:uncharacterized membrane protein
MFHYLRNFHRFLASQLFYPILLSSLLAMGFYIGRVLLSHSWVVYRNLVWNLFLAWVPYLFSVFASGLQRILPRQWWMLLVPGAIWLVFFPNAPYLLTDFLHLEPRPYIPMWYDIGLLATFAWTGLFLGIASLRIMQSLVRSYLGAFVGWLFAAIALGLGGLGLYLGRFSRWNSWDLLIHPKSILIDVATRLVEPSSNLRFFGFVIMFSAFLLVCYLTFISVHRTSEMDQSRRL